MLVEQIINQTVSRSMFLQNKVWGKEAFEAMVLVGNAFTPGASTRVRLDGPTP